VRWVLGLALVVAVGGMAAAFVAAAGQSGAPTEIRMRYSSFAPGSIEVVAGRPVTFVLRNDDPIDHEWIVGDDGVHERHRAGTEPVHASRPTEVSVPAGAVRETTVVFEQPGTYRFICHLPGHEAYGMVGTVVVRP
jgi:uncharacterized cupredoxin-like copper-binding protein